MGWWSRIRFLQKLHQKTNRKRSIPKIKCLNVLSSNTFSLNGSSIQEISQFLLEVSVDVIVFLSSIRCSKLGSKVMSLHPLRSNPWIWLFVVTGSIPAERITLTGFFKMYTWALPGPRQFNVDEPYKYGSTAIVRNFVNNHQIQRVRIRGWTSNLQISANFGILLR